MRIIQQTQKREIPMKYPAYFQPCENGYVVKFRDIPKAITQGHSIENAIEMAEDALLTALSFYFEDNRNIPKPSPPAASERLISLPLSAWVKVMLLNALLDDRVSQTCLANRMGIKPQQVTRIVNLKHSTKIDTLEAAFKALGRDLELQVTQKAL